MQYQVIVSDRARQMLVEHVAFLAQRDAAAAKKLRAHLMQALRSLEQLPHRCPFFNENYLPANKYHRLLAADRYLILYQIRDDRVLVDWVVDCRQDYGWLLR